MSSAGIPQEEVSLLAVFAPCCSAVGKLIGFVFIAPILLLTPLVDCSSQEQSSGESAGIVHEDLQLQEGGKNRARALALYYKALRSESAGDSADAISLFQEVLELVPGNPRIARQAAELIISAGAGLQGGVNLLEDALAASPDDPEAKLHLSAFLAAYGDGEDRTRAIQLAQEAVADHPGNS